MSQPCIRSAQASSARRCANCTSSSFDSGDVPALSAAIESSAAAGVDPKLIEHAYIYKSALEKDARKTKARDVYFSWILQGASMDTSAASFPDPPVTVLSDCGLQGVLQ